MLGNALQGGLAGLLATAPMTAAMKVMHRRLPRHEQAPLPPRQITMRLAERANVDHYLDGRQRKAVTLASHFSFGTAVGSLYGLLCQRIVRPGVGSGALYGLCVWAGSYLGLLPALGLLSPATHHPPRRTWLMIVAHLVWGVTLGGLLQLSQPVRRSR
jgi:uncharacterized membrane protein YagU involved in acid resistance